MKISRKNNMPLKALASRPVFTTHFFTVNEVDVIIPNGEQKLYHNVVRRPAVSAFALTDKKELYLVKQYRYLLDSDCIEGVAGFIEDNEEPLNAAKRELKEETGIEAKSWMHLTDLELSAGVARMVQPLFLAQGLTEGEQHFDEGEDIEVLKLPLDEAIERIEKGEINTAATIVGILMIDRMIKEGKITL